MLALFGFGGSFNGPEFAAVVLLALAWLFVLWPDLVER